MLFFLGSLDPSNKGKYTFKTLDLVEKCLTLDLNVPILILINEACAKCVEDLIDSITFHPMAFSKAQHREMETFRGFVTRVIFFSISQYTGSKNVKKD